MEFFAGVWEFATFTMAARRGLFWLVIGLVVVSVTAALVQFLIAVAPARHQWPFLVSIALYESRKHS